MDMIWWDSQCYMGRGAKSEYATEEANLGPENKRQFRVTKGVSSEPDVPHRP